MVCGPGERGSTRPGDRIPPPGKGGKKGKGKGGKDGKGGKCKDGKGGGGDARPSTRHMVPTGLGL